MVDATEMKERRWISSRWRCMVVDYLGVIGSRIRVSKQAGSLYIGRSVVMVEMWWFNCGVDVELLNWSWLRVAAVAISRGRN